MKAYGEKIFMIVASLWGVLITALSRPRLIVLGNDMIGSLPYEPRMARVYQWLDGHQVRYVHLIHAAPHGQVVGHWRRRHGPVVYLEALEHISPRVLTWFVRFSGVRQLWGIDDFRHWPTVVAATRQAHVRSVLFQHGRFNRHKVGIELPDHSFAGSLPDLYIVWNGYWQQKLLALSAPFASHSDRILVGGKPSASVTISRSAHEHSGGGPLRVVLLHEPAASSVEVRQFVAQLNAIDGIERIYKVRKDQSVDSQLHHHDLGGPLSTGWMVTSDLVPADLVLGSYSTLLYEMIEQKVPVGVLKIKSMQADDLVLDGLASSIDPQATDLRVELDRAVQASSEELSRRAEHMHISVPIEKTLEALFAMIKK